MSKRTQIDSVTNNIIGSFLETPAPHNNYFCRSQGRHVNEIFTDTHDLNMVWQPDVYSRARDIAIEHDCRVVIDLGCGAGDKLVAQVASHGLRTIGVDFHSSLLAAREKYPDLTWLECDLTDPDQILKLLSDHSPSRPIIVLSDVIEHLTDPRPLVAALRQLLLGSPGSRLIISTPDRDLLNCPPNEPPLNKAHTREWSFEELQYFFQNSGFVVEKAEHTRSNELDVVNATTLLVVAAERQAYTTFLHGINIDSEVEVQRVILSTEFPGITPSGGIGTYVRSQMSADETGSTLVLLLGKKPVQYSPLPNVLWTEDLIGQQVSNHVAVDEVALIALEQLLFLVPSIRAVHYQDYHGIGLRVAQAKKCGLLPREVETIVHCHGTTHYVENANAKWYGVETLELAEKERLSVELSSQVIFLSDYLRKFYNELGFDLSDASVHHIPTPYYLEGDRCKSKKINTLVFVGKMSEMKGYPLFLRTCLQNRDKLLALGINTIRVLARIGAARHEGQIYLEKLEHDFTLDVRSDLDTDGILNALRLNTSSSLCVLPYRDDNFPLMVFEVVSAGTVPIVSSTGGMPEMLHGGDYSDFIMPRWSEEGLMQAIMTVATLPPIKRDRLWISLLGDYRSAAETSKLRLKGLETAARQTKAPEKNLTISVVVPYFNTHLEYVSDLIFGLNCQILQPEEVVFVDDASNSGLVEELQSLLKKSARFNWKIISHEVNQGLPAARNTALAMVSSDILANIDSDDVPLPNFLRNIVLGLSSNPAASACIPYLSYFADGDDFQRAELFSEGSYRPVGGGIAATLLRNIAGHANAGVRVSAARSLGGWNQSSRSKWEDWEFYLRLLGAGQKILVSPVSTVLYRVRNTSMARTYDNWGGERRLASAELKLNRYETSRVRGYLQSASRTEADLRQEIAFLNEELDRARSRIAVRMANRIRRDVKRYPAANWLARHAVHFAWKMAHVVRRH